MITGNILFVCLWRGALWWEVAVFHVLYWGRSGDCVWNILVQCDKLGGRPGSSSAKDLLCTTSLWYLNNPIFLSVLVVKKSEFAHGRHLDWGCSCSLWHFRVPGGGLCNCRASVPLRASYLRNWRRRQGMKGCRAFCHRDAEKPVLCTLLFFFFMIYQGQRWRHRKTKSLFTVYSPGNIKTGSGDH